MLVDYGAVESLPHRLDSLLIFTLVLEEKSFSLDARRDELLSKSLRLTNLIVDGLNSLIKVLETLGEETMVFVFLSVNLIYLCSILRLEVFNGLIETLLSVFVDLLNKNFLVDTFGEGILPDDLFHVVVFLLLCCLVS